MSFPNPSPENRNPAKSTSRANPKTPDPRPKRTNHHSLTQDYPARHFPEQIPDTQLLRERQSSGARRKTACYLPARALGALIYASGSAPTGRFGLTPRARAPPSTTITRGIDIVYTRRRPLQSALSLACPIIIETRRARETGGTRARLIARPAIMKPPRGPRNPFHTRTRTRGARGWL